MGIKMLQGLGHKPSTDVFNQLDSLLNTQTTQKQLLGCSYLEASGGNEESAHGWIQQKCPYSDLWATLVVVSEQKGFVV